MLFKLVGFLVLFFFKVPSSDSVDDLVCKNGNKPKQKKFQCEVCQKGFNIEAVKNLHAAIHEDKSHSNTISSKRAKSQSSPFVQQALKRMREMKAKSNKCQVINSKYSRV